MFSLVIDPRKVAAVGQTDSQRRSVAQLDNNYVQACLDCEFFYSQPHHIEGVKVLIIRLTERNHWPRGMVPPSASPRSVVRDTQTSIHSSQWIKHICRTIETWPTTRKKRYKRCSRTCVLSRS